MSGSAFSLSIHWSLCERLCSCCSPGTTVVHVQHLVCDRTDPFAATAAPNWKPCTDDLSRCTPAQLQLAQRYHSITVGAMASGPQSCAPNLGRLSRRVSRHCQSSEWTNSAAILGVSAAQAGTSAVLPVLPFSSRPSRVRPF